MSAALVFTSDDLTASERAVYIQLSPGRANAVTAARLADLCGLSRRDVEKAVETLVKHHRIPVLSATEAPPGYFLAVSEEERIHYVRSLDSRMRELWRRRKAIRLAVLPEPRQPPEQVSLPLG